MATNHLSDCSECGNELGDHPAFRFGLPDALVGVADDDIFYTGDSPFKSPLLFDKRSSDVYVRAVLHDGAYCVWVKLTPGQAAPVIDAWNGDSYATLAFTGILANTLCDEMSAGDTVSAAVEDATHLPVISENMVLES